MATTDVTSTPKPVEVALASSSGDCSLSNIHYVNDGIAHA